MADLDKILETLKDSAIGAAAVTTAEILTGGTATATAAGIGAVIGAAASLLKEEDKEQTNRSSSTSAMKEPEQHYEPSLDFNASNTSSFGSSQGVMAGGGTNTQDVHVYHHDGDKPTKVWDCNKGEDWDVYDYSPDHAPPPPFFSEPEIKETDVLQTCLTETENCESCGIQVPEYSKETMNTIKPKKQIPQEVQAAIDKHLGKSPLKPCQKHGVEIPVNSCFGAGQGGGMCDHLAKYDGTKMRHHCIYPRTRKGVHHDTQKNGNLADYIVQNLPADFVASECNTCGSDVCSESINSPPTPFKAGKPLKQHRKSNRTHLTGIEINNLLNLADKTNVGDKESLKQELRDHIDETLTFAENKAMLEEYLSAVTPMNTNITDAEVKEIEERMARDAQKKIAQKRWEDDTLIDMLKMRVEQGDSSARSELELIEIERASFAPPVPSIEPVSIPAFPTESISPPAFEPAPPIEPIITPVFPLENPIVTTPIIETPPTIDPAMSWNSSTPETIKFSETFVPPEPIDVVGSFNVPAPEAAKNSTQNSFSIY